MKKMLLNLTLLSLTSLVFAQNKIDYANIPSLVKEAKENGNAKLSDSLAQEYIDNYLLKLKDDLLMTKENLRFIKGFLVVGSKGFSFFEKNKENVNAILGDYAAQYGIRMAIYNAYIPKGDINSRKNFDWKSLEQTVISKFGIVGQEEVYCNAMITYLEAEDWTEFGKYYLLYFKNALKHPVYNVNNLTWQIFEHVDDQKILRFACDDVMKYAIEKWYQTNFRAYDTYANLLFKIGKREVAINWEERAVKLSNNNEEVIKNLEKMKRNTPTWITDLAN